MPDINVSVKETDDLASIITDLVEISDYMDMQEDQLTLLKAGKELFSQRTPGDRKLSVTPDDIKTLRDLSLTIPTFAGEEYQESGKFAREIWKSGITRIASEETQDHDTQEVCKEAALAHAGGQQRADVRRLLSTDDKGILWVLSDVHTLDALERSLEERGLYGSAQYISSLSGKAEDFLLKTPLTGWDGENHVLRAFDIGWVHSRRDHRTKKTDTSASAVKKIESARQWWESRGAGAGGNVNTDKPSGSTDHNKTVGEKIESSDYQLRGEELNHATVAIDLLRELQWLLLRDRTIAVKTNQTALTRIDETIGTLESMCEARRLQNIFDQEFAEREPSDDILDDETIIGQPYPANKDMLLRYADSEEEKSFIEENSEDLISKKFLTSYEKDPLKYPEKSQHIATIAKRLNELSTGEHTDELVHVQNVFDPLEKIRMSAYSDDVSTKRAADDDGSMEAPESPSKRRKGKERM